jgi:hypothetical protein
MHSKQKKTRLQTKEERRGRRCTMNERERETRDAREKMKDTDPPISSEKKRRSMCYLFFLGDDIRHTNQVVVDGEKEKKSPHITRL